MIAAIPHPAHALLRSILCLALVCGGTSCAEPKAEAPLPLPLSAVAALDPTTGILAVTLRCTGVEPVAIHQSDLVRQRGTIGFTLVPIDPPAGVLPKAGTTHGAKAPRVVAGQDRPAKPKLGAITLVGDLTAGYAFPVWESGFWADLPNCFATAPRWEIRPASAVLTASAQGQPDAVRTAAEVHGFVIDLETYQRIEALRPR